jgi:hypothetical protein
VTGKEEHEGQGRRSTRDGEGGARGTGKEEHEGRGRRSTRDGEGGARGTGKEEHEGRGRKCRVVGGRSRWRRRFRKEGKQALHIAAVYTCLTWQGVPQAGRRLEGGIHQQRDLSQRGGADDAAAEEVEACPPAVQGGHCLGVSSMLAGLEPGCA